MGAGRGPEASGGSGGVAPGASFGGILGVARLVREAVKGNPRFSSAAISLARRRYTSSSCSQARDTVAPAR
jgi:hypothetical protein